MTGCVILNPSAGGAANALQLREAIAASDLALFESESAEHARALAAEAAAQGVDLVVAAGGDGTIHDIVNGLMEASGEGTLDTALAIIPLGTGNDLARTLSLPPDPLFTLELAQKGARRHLDLIRVEIPGQTLYAINVCAGGFSGAVNEQLSPEMKQAWGPFSYLLSAARALPDLSGHRTEIAWDDAPAEPVEALSVIVANGRTAAGGKAVAPHANPEDGLLDVVVIRACQPASIGLIAAQLVTGNYLANENVLHRRARTLHVSATPGMWFNADGELLTSEPITFSIVPGALSVVVGPQYSPDPPLLDVA